MIRRTLKTPAVAVLTALALIASGCAADGDSTPKSSPSKSEVTTDTPLKQSPKEADADDDAESEENPEEEATSSDDAVGEAVEEYLLSTFDVDNFQELPSDHWGYFIVGVEGDSFKTVQITMQLGQDDPEAQGASETIFSLIGSEFPNLEWVEVLDGAGVHIEQTKRSDVPLLNM